MTQLLDLLATHWLALVLLVAAGVCGLLAAVGRRNVPLLVTLAVGMGAFALGSVFLHGWKWSLSTGGERWSLGGGVMLAAVAMLYALVMLVLTVRFWNGILAGLLGVVAVAGFGGWVGRPTAEFLAEAGKSVFYTRFVSPWWLLLLALAPLVYIIGRKSLSGLGPVRRWVAITARTLVVVLIVLALAEPRVRRPSENMTVLFVVDRSASVPREREKTLSGDAIDRRWGRIQELIEGSTSARYGVNRSDQFGVMMFAKRPKLAFPPTPVLALKNRIDEAGVILDENYTDIGAALKLALASFPEGSGKRVVLVSDGNQNLGNAEEQAELARKNGVVIDSIALAPNGKNESDVLVQAVEAPPVAATGSRLPIRVYVRNASPNRDVTGTLELIRIGGQQEADQPTDREVPIDIDDGPEVLNLKEKPARVRLKPGLNVFKFRDREQARADASYTYRAKFVPDEGQSAGDRIANNTADAAVVARGTRRVLFLTQAKADEVAKHTFLLEQLRKAKIQFLIQPAERLPKNKTDLGVYLSNFDCVILANVPYDDFTEDQAEVIRTQVYDQGCGLVMLGGPDSYGPGGYQQTPIEAALPVECEIKAKKALGKGGLVLIMHASEMADGNKWQKEMAKLAIQRLNPADMVGVVDWQFVGGQVNWIIPFEVIGDRKPELYAKIDKMSPGDMPDFDPFLEAAADTLTDPKHNLSVKHCILISDGDPMFAAAGQAALKKMSDNGATCTTIGVATHGAPEDQKMRQIAESTKDANGNPGNFHKPKTGKDLPAIYIKETRKISQSFIFDREFRPDLRFRGAPTDGLADNLPSLFGFVRTTNKQSPTQTMWIEGPKDKQAPEQEFPILATWRYGLGKAVAFTSDARNDAKGWGRNWAADGIAQKFWENVVNWAMREAESGELAVSTRYVDGKVKVTVTAENQAKDKNGKPLPLAGLTLRGGVSTPNKPGPGDKTPGVVFKPNKNGFYEAEFDATEAGAYFLNVQAEVDELDENGRPILVPQTDKEGKPLLDKNGQPVMVPKRRAFGARAGVTVPYSPEYIDLESNTALMKKLAEATGGQYFDEPNDPSALVKAHDFYRPGPEVVRSVLPFWFWLVFAAGLLLFLDVGVRRISLEFKEVRSGARRLWAKLRRGEDLPPDEDGVLSRLGQRKQATAAAIAKRAARKFEAADDLPADAAPAGADDYAADVGKKGGALPPPPPPRGSTKTEEEDDDFMSRMKKAKKRGQQKQDGE
ncbi:MAG: VWA domain-containing protein [Fimbriiglobus sp.]|nr:VWA domain-containing protein [Fimbriiglobus sp.]